MNTVYIDSKIGILELVSDGIGICTINFVTERKQDHPDALCEQCATELNEYFNKQRHVFNVALHPIGTPFQLSVWDALTKIPYGEVVSYKQVAMMIGNEKASRAVGMANNRNPIPVIIPCHRVIGANGKLVGYGGGLDKKEVLLELEKV